MNTTAQLEPLVQGAGHLFGGACDAGSGTKDREFHFGDGKGIPHATVGHQPGHASLLGRQGQDVSPEAADEVVVRAYDQDVARLGQRHGGVWP